MRLPLVITACLVVALQSGPAAAEGRSSRDAVFTVSAQVVDGCGVQGAAVTFPAGDRGGDTTLASAQLSLKCSQPEPLIVSFGERLRADGVRTFERPRLAAPPPPSGAVGDTEHVRVDSARETSTTTIHGRLRGRAPITTARDRAFVLVTVWL
jgi:hypothetical protein